MARKVGQVLLNTHPKGGVPWRDGLLCECGSWDGGAHQLLHLNLQCNEDLWENVKQVLDGIKVLRL